jgi:hypothetical protein
MIGLMPTLRRAADDLRRSLRGSRGQALPMAMGALALGALLVTPLLTGASTNSKATGLVGQRALERYSMDAGIEWSGWRLLSNPRLTAATSYTDSPLQPLPAAVNGQPFASTEIRYVAGGGAVEATSPAWQGGGGDRCYGVSASDAGTLSIRVTVDSGAVWAALLPAGAPCVRPSGLAALSGSSPYGADFTLGAAGDYQVLVGASTATTGTLAMSIPAATYDVQSTVGARTTVAWLVAGYSGVRVVSWQLN